MSKLLERTYFALAVIGLLLIWYFNIRFFVLNKRGETAGVAMYHAGETKYGLCNENGAAGLELEPLLPGAPEG